MDSHTLWLVAALVFFLVAAFQGMFRQPAGVVLWGIHPGWLGCAAVTCFFLIK